MRPLIATALMALGLFLMLSAKLDAANVPAAAQSYDTILDAGYGIIRYQGQTMLVKPEFARTYLDTAYCESGYDEKAEGALGERGYLQIHGVHKARIERLGYDWDSMYFLWPNLVVAYDIWIESESWDAWSCK